MNSDQTRKPRPGSGVRGVSVVSAGKRGSWRVTVFAGHHPDGRPNRAHFRFRGTKRQAVDAGIAKRDEIALAPYDPHDRTVGEWFEQVWLPYKRAQVARGDRSPSTVDKYARNYRLYIKPFAISRAPLLELDSRQGPPMLVRWFNELATTGGPRGRLSQKSIHHALSVMHAALEYARKAGPLELDAFRRFPDELRPRLREYRPSKRSVGSAGARVIREVFRGHKMEAMVALALCGLRTGEILGLRIRGGEDPDNGDVVLDSPQPLVRVRQVAVRVDGQGARIREQPKTDSSIRDVALPVWAVPILRAAKLRALEMRLRAGDAWQEHDLLFPSAGQPRSLNGARSEPARPGRSMHPGVLSLAFKKHLRAASPEGIDVEAVSLHSLRHTFVSTLINEGGMRAEDVQYLAGHADLRTTQRYRARDDAPAAAAARALDELARIAADTTNE